MPDRFPHPLHTAPELGALLHHVGHALARVDDGGVVAPAERLADLDELEAEHLARELHRHLAGDGEVLGAGLRAKSLGSDSPLLSDGLLDCLGLEAYGCWTSMLARSELVS